MIPLRNTFLDIKNNVRIISYNKYFLSYRTILSEIWLVGNYKHQSKLDIVQYEVWRTIRERIIYFAE